MEKKVTIYFNPECSKCNSALCSLEEKGFQTEIIEYLKDTPSEEESADLLKKLGMSAKEIIRVSEPIFIEKYSGKELSESEWIKAMVEHPVLIQRPIIVRGNQAVLGRSEEKIDEITE
jgi:arsenate reductase (glutaredoxin)